MFRFHTYYILLVFPVLSMTFDAQLHAADLDAYEARTFSSPEGELLYRLLIPENYDPAKKYPLVLFLHGAGERGNDNQKQLVHVVSTFVEPAARAKYPCFVVAPQCPSGKLWCNAPWSVKTVVQPEDPSEAMTLTMQLLDSLEKEYSIDTNRLYVMGLSMGGFGTWDAVTRYPGKFAAAVPMCGGGDTKKAGIIKDLPVWNFHGSSDGAVKVQLSRDMIAAIEAAGGKPKYTEYPGVGHNCWTPATQEPELLPWLFSQSLDTDK